MKKFYVVSALVATSTLSTGCAGVGTMANNTIANQSKSGTIFALNSGQVASAKEACELVKGRDPRCSEPEKYHGMTLISEVDFYSGAKGAIALADKSIPLGEVCSRPGWGATKCTFYKAYIEPGRLATVAAVASAPGEGKCDWSGLNGAGGVVCHAYGWDYKKDNGAAVTQ